MFKPSAACEVYLYTGVMDMRYGIDRLSSFVKEKLNRSVLGGGLYVFLSKRRDRVKVIYFDRDGYCFWFKRLEVGVFKVEKIDGYENISGVDLQELLNGIEFSRLKFRKNVEKGSYGSL